jgi:hypothetical protein
MHTAQAKLTGGLGLASGWLIAPVFGLISYARQARTFHPRGPVLHASVEPHADAPPDARALAERLRGSALVRFSGALWKRERRLPDVLGCALRLRHGDGESAAALGDDQDLLFATIRRPWSMPLSPLTTHVHDYLANDYFAVSPFRSPDVTQPFYLRLHPVAWESDGRGTRSARLDRAVRAGAAMLNIELSARPFDGWRPLARVRLERTADVDDEALRFDPFRAGRRIQPFGFIHALRVGVYKLSQLGRARALC